VTAASHMSRQSRVSNPHASGKFFRIVRRPASSKREEKIRAHVREVAGRLGFPFREDRPVTS